MSKASQTSAATLWIVGMPLEEGQPPFQPAIEILERADFILAENRKTAFSFLKHISGFREKEIAFLDGAQPEKGVWQDRLQAAASHGESVVLFSDTGMPIAFDPGKEILDFCRQQGFRIRCVPGPTSWGTAIAISGWTPPFFIADFLPRETAGRLKALQKIEVAMAAGGAHAVFLETPYRFHVFLKDAIQIFPKRDAFLAWNIGHSSENYFWGSAKEILLAAEKKDLKKGEFILMISADRKGNRL